MVLLVYMQGRRQTLMRTQPSDKHCNALHCQEPAMTLNRERLEGKSRATLHLAQAGLLRLQTASNARQLEVSGLTSITRR